MTLVVSGWAGTWQEARRRRKNPTGDMSFFAFRPFFGGPTKKLLLLAPDIFGF